MYWLWPSIIWSFALFKWSHSWHWNIKKDFDSHFKVSWKLQCETLVSKADSQLGLVRRSGYFINIEKQKCTLYIIMVPSIYNTFRSEHLGKTSLQGFDIIHNMQLSGCLRNPIWAILITYFRKSRGTLIGQKNQYYNF